MDSTPGTTLPHATKHSSTRVNVTVRATSRLGKVLSRRTTSVAMDRFWQNKIEKTTEPRSLRGFARLRVASLRQVARETSTELRWQLLGLLGEISVAGR